MENNEKIDSKEKITTDNEPVNSNETDSKEPVKIEKEYLHWIKRNMSVNANDETQALIADVLQKYDNDKQTSSITQYIKNTSHWLKQLHDIATEQKTKIKELNNIIAELQALPIQEPTPTSTQEPTPTPTPVQEPKKTSYLNLLGF